MERLSQHWPEYLAEALGLGIFMFSASFFAVLIEHPASRLTRVLQPGIQRRFWMGLAMGLTALALIYSPLGTRSGAHLNPAVTLTFWHLDRIPSGDAVAYIVAQFCGGLAGIALARVCLRSTLAHPSIAFVATQPGPRGKVVALGAEFLISGLLMLVVLTSSAIPESAPYTGCFAASLVFLYITFEAPLSGMSMNPARTLASALPARRFSALWLYFLGPVAGMLAAAEIHQALAHPVLACAKLFHTETIPCLFCEAKAKILP